MSEREWIKASEIGEYIYCQRAWWLRRQGVAQANIAELLEGSRQHLRHGRRWQALAWQRGLALALLLAAVLLLARQWAG
jgi:hypothetical protein